MIGGSITRPGPQTPVKADAKLNIDRHLALASTSSKSDDEDAIDQRFKKKANVFSPTVVTPHNITDTPLRIP